MSKTKLVVCDESQSEKYRIKWYFTDEGDLGGALGESFSERPEPKIDITDQQTRDDWETWIADKIAAPTRLGLDIEGFYWESAKDAKAVIKTINKHIKEGPSRKLDVAITHATALRAFHALCSVRCPLNDEADAINELRKVLGFKEEAH